MMRRMFAILHARNLEFIRDRRTVAFTVLLPLVFIVGIKLIFDAPRPLLKVGVLTHDLASETHPLLEQQQYIAFVPVTTMAEGTREVATQQLDLLLDPHETTRYWVNADSPKGALAERLLIASDQSARRNIVSDAQLRYSDWLLPGILGMNMLFTCLSGIGSAVLHYRKSGFLKRLYATPLTAFEFLSAQILSRLGTTLVALSLLFIGISLLIGLHSRGSTWLLLGIAALGATSLIALGLGVAATFSRDEIVNGVLNLLTWPMMLLSGIWFPLDGAPPWLQQVADLFPLTHALKAARAVILDGAGLSQVAPSLGYMSVLTIVFLAIGAARFRWRAE